MHLIEEREGRSRSAGCTSSSGTNYILSVRNNHARLPRRACAASAEPKMLAKGPGYVLAALMDAVVDGYFPLIDKLETEVEALEDASSQGRGQHNMRRLYRLKRKVTLLKHAVLPLMEAAGKTAQRACAGSA